MNAPIRREAPGGALVLGLLGAPGLWILHFLLSYFLVTLACAGALPASRVWLLAITVAAVFAASWLGAVAGRPLRAKRADLTDVERFLAWAGVWLTAGFVLILVVEGMGFVLLGSWCGAPGP